MVEVGIRALKQNASAVVARAGAGETITVTDRGRPVAHLGPLPNSALQRLLESGQARAPLYDLRECPPPAPLADDETPTALSDALTSMRDDERY